MYEWFPVIVVFGFIQAPSLTIGDVNGGWGGWGEWTPCSVSCGYGTIKRSRHWIYGDGQVTNYTYTYISECWTEKPCPIHGGWGMWTGWSPCPVMCGGSNMTRTRLCNTPKPARGGRPCNGTAKQTELCNPEQCPKLPPNFDISVCNDSSFMCESGLQCVTETARCDFQLDCHDGTDERGCTVLSLEIGSFASSTIPDFLTVILNVVMLTLNTCIWTLS